MLSFFQSIPLSYYVFGTILNFSISIFIGTLLVKKTADLKPNRIFAIYAYCVAFWSLFYTFSMLAPNQALSLFLLRTCMLGVFPLPVLFFHFICSFINDEKHSKFIKLNYFITFILMLFTYSNYYANTPISSGVIKYWLKAGPLLTVSIIYFVAVILYAYYLIFKRIATLEKGLEKVKLWYIFIGTFLGHIAGLSNYLVWYQFNFPPILNILTTIYIINIPYVIMRYKLVDINFVFKKIISYIIYLLFSGTLIYILLGISFKAFTFKVLLIVFGSVTLLPLFYLLIKNIIDSIILKDFKIRLRSLEDFFTTKNYPQIPNTVQGWTEYFVNKLHNITNVSRTLIFCISREVNGYTLFSQVGGNELKNHRFEINDPLIKYLKKTKGYIVKSELNPHKKESAELLKIMNALEFELLFSFFAEDELIGLLALGDRKGTNLFHEKEVEKLAYLVKAIEHSLSNVYFTQDMEEFKNIAKRFAEFKDRKELSQYLISSIMRLFNSSNVAIYLHDTDKKIYSCEAQKGYPEAELLVDISENNYLFKFLKGTETPLLYNDLKNKIGAFEVDDFKSSLELMKNLKAEIIIPLVSSQTLGFIVIGKKRTDMPYSNNDMLMYSQLSIISAIKIHSIMIKEESELDPLTRARNRASLNSWMNRFILSAKQEKKSLAVLAMDLDFFKAINDLKGHKGGDEVLKELVEKIHEVSRPKDMIFRTGGEEFLWLLSDITSEDILKVKARLLTALKHGKYTKTLTLSIGQVIFKPDRDESKLLTSNIKSLEKTILRLSDDAVYLAKNTGRNRLCDSGEIKDSEINDEYNLTIQLVCNNNDSFDELSGYFIDNNIEIIKSNWDTIIEIFENKRPDGFLFIVDKNLNLETIKEKITEVKKRTLSSLVSVVLKDDQMRKDLKELNIDRFFNIEETKLIEDWTKVLSKELS